MQGVLTQLIQNKRFEENPYYSVSLWCKWKDSVTSSIEEKIKTMIINVVIDILTLYTTQNKLPFL